MVVVLNLLCLWIVAVTVAVQTSSSKRVEAQSARSRGWDSTISSNLTRSSSSTISSDSERPLHTESNFSPTIAGNKSIVANSTRLTHGLNILTDPLQHVNIGQSETVLQGCSDGTLNPVVQDCTCETKLVAAQAMDDAMTMVRTARLVYSNPTNTMLLDYFLGSGCTSQTATDYIEEVFQNLTNIQEYQWLQSDPNWLQDTTYTVNDGELFVYCADGVPYPQPPLFSAECRLNASVGWTYADDAAYIGLCNSTLVDQNYISRAAMLEKAKAGQVNLLGEEIGLNYGRVVLSLLVNLPSVNLEAQTVDQYYGWSDVTLIAKLLTCTAALGNADSWALWINALYFANALSSDASSTSTSSTAQLIVSSNCGGASLECSTLMKQYDCWMASQRYDPDTIYHNYTSHWYNSDYNEGCTAIFSCPDDNYPYISGADLQYGFNQIYTSVESGGAGCGKSLLTATIRNALIPVSLVDIDGLEYSNPGSECPQDKKRHQRSGNVRTVP